MARGTTRGSNARVSRSDLGRPELPGILDPNPRTMAPEIHEALDRFPLNLESLSRILHLVRFRI